MGVLLAAAVRDPRGVTIRVSGPAAPFRLTS